MPLKCHFCCTETCAPSHPHRVFLKQRPPLKSSTIFDIQRLRMSQRPQLLKLLTSERDGVLWQCYWWMLLLRVMAPSASTHTHIQYMWVRLGCFSQYCKNAQERLRKRTEPPCGVCWVSVMCWEATGTNVDSVIPLESDRVQIHSWFIFVNAINLFTRVNKIVVICVVFLSVICQRSWGGRKEMCFHSTALEAAVDPEYPMILLISTP